MNVPRLCFFVTCSALILGCTKETITERVIAPERQATAQMSDAVTIDSLNQVKIAKTSLGKAFILLPTMTSSGKYPDVNFLKPLIVSFEKAGDQIALFNLTDEQLYNSVPSSRLLQTFNILAEDDSSILLKLSKGFTSFDTQPTLTVLLKDLFTETKKAIQSGVQSSVEVKESFVRSVKSENNSVFITQVARIKAQSIQEKTDPMDPTSKAKPMLVSEESTITFLFELKPYIGNPSFAIRTYDKDQRVGYFLNFVVKEQQEDPIPQIVRWDANPARGPIIVKLSTNTPADAVKALEEGILYWNRVAGQELLKIGSPFKTDEKQTDRSIFVYWLPWETAGFARAGLQADPLTGEILRGQVIMTSSWFKMPRDGFSLMMKPQSNQPAVGNALCTLDQSKIVGSALSDSQETSAVEKASVDTIRTVLAHEMGHVLGLRHNFAGSSTRAITDAELMLAKENYLLGNHTELRASSTTVMDYTGPIETAMNGAVILNSVLPYDKLAIEWGTFGKEIKAEKNQYCSDEHILLASSSKKSIYGCERFDGAKNMIQGALVSLIENEKRKVITEFKNAVRVASQPKSYYEIDATLDSWLSQLNFSSMIDSYSFENFLYKDPAATFYSIDTAVSGLLPSLNGSALTTTDPLIQKIILTDSAEVGGLAGIVEKIMSQQLASGGKFYQNQVLAFFETLEPAYYQNKISAEQLEKIKAKMLEQAISADGKFAMTVISSLPVSKMLFSVDPATKEIKSAEANIIASLWVGKNESLVQLYSSEYERTMRQRKVQVSVNGVLKELKFSSLYNPDLDILRKLFSPALVSSLGLNSATLTEAKERLKVISVANTMDILKSTGLTLTEPITSASLTTSVNGIDWSKVTGVTKYELVNEILELKKWEELK